MTNGKEAKKEKKGLLSIPIAPPAGETFAMYLGNIVAATTAVPSSSRTTEHVSGCTIAMYVGGIRYHAMREVNVIKKLSRVHVYQRI